MLSILRRRRRPVSPNNWWTQTFNGEEQALIEQSFKPLGSANTTAESMARSSNPIDLGGLANHLKKQELRHLGYKLLDRAEMLLTEDVPLFDLHFYLGGRGAFYYRWRDQDTFALSEAIKSFKRQVEIGASVAKKFRDDTTWGFIPAHAGYRQLRIIEEKRGNWTAARALCEQAKAEGWADDWDHCIARIDKKQASSA